MKSTLSEETRWCHQHGLLKQKREVCSITSYVADIEQWEKLNLSSHLRNDRRLTRDIKRNW